MSSKKITGQWDGDNPGEPGKPVKSGRQVFPTDVPMPPVDFFLKNNTTDIPVIDTKKQVGGDHYAKMTIQPIDFIIGNDLGFCEGNVIKYICRYKDKGGVQDLLKARQYIDFLIKKTTHEQV